jgi:uncharacterized protein (DUF1330 family)
MKKTIFVVSISALGGIALRAGAVERLYAQAEPPAYVITDADVTNVDAYSKEYLPLVRKAFLDGGGKYVASNGKSLLSPASHQSAAILAFENLDRAQAALTSAAFKNARSVGEKYARRTFAIEGVQR